ncbi:MAG: protein-tyrosine phosphatase family protein [Armatimonadota bacterium]
MRQERAAAVVDNFGWLEGGRIAGSGVPASADEVWWLHRQGIRAIVSLHPVSAAVEAEIELLRMEHKVLPVQDMGVPDDGQIDDFLQFVEEQLGQGNPCLVHCYAGIGRAGTMLALYLVSKGADPQEAIDRLGGLQSEPQKALIHEFAARGKR